MNKTKVKKGDKYGRLTAVGPSRPGYWMFQCECGGTKESVPSKVSEGYVKSCGCLRHDIMLERNKPTHGESGTRLYRIWRSMKKRCGVPNTHAYERYGGRGIRVCQEWRDSYPAFSEWAKSNGYQDDLTIDRIDGDGNYCPENCRWVDMVTQERNRCNTRRAFFEGELRPLGEIRDMTGVPYYTLYKRIIKQGWSAAMVVYGKDGAAV